VGERVPAGYLGLVFKPSCSGSCKAHGVDRIPTSARSPCSLVARRRSSCAFESYEPIHGS
jgi:hypothetical protein